jgi:hypothetical protein
MIGSNCDESPKAVKATRFTNLENIALLQNKTYEQNGQEMLAIQIAGLWF